MKTKSFYDLLKKRLTAKQITEIERQAQLEIEILRSIQKWLNNHKIFSR